MTLNALKASLWPPAPYNAWLVKNARQRAKETYGVDSAGGIRDVGALRENVTGVQVRTAEGWQPWSEEHRFIANVFNRVGPGWSMGSNSIHNSARAWFEVVHGRTPDPMENVDIQFNKALFDSLQARYLALTGEPPTPPPAPKPAPIPPTPPPVPAPTPSPKPAGPATLSPASQRAEEVLHMLLSVDVPLPNLFWNLVGVLVKEGKPFLVEAIRVWRLGRRKLGDPRDIPAEDPR